MRLGKRNEKIEYTFNDEIGQLVLQYNRTVDELEQSARLLAKSERESAWKSMARQVAHEINNPLAIIYLHTKKLSDYAEKKPLEKIPDLHKRYFKILESIKRIEKVLNGLKTYSQTNPSLKLRNSPLAYNYKVVLHYFLR